MSVAKKIQIVEDIWHSIIRNPEQLPLSETEKMELDKRLADYEKNPDHGIEWKPWKRTSCKANRARNNCSPWSRLEAREAFDYYEEISEGLGFDFMRSLDAAIQSVKRSPLAYQKI